MDSVLSHCGVRADVLAAEGASLKQSGPPGKEALPPGAGAGGASGGAGGGPQLSQQRARPGGGWLAPRSVRDWTEADLHM